MAELIFNRIEKKYLMPEPVYLALRRRLEPHMAVDRYGEHTIRNLYYDTADALLIRRSIEKPVYKEKLRLRSYGPPDPAGMAFLEIKKKFQQVVSKRRIELPLPAAYAYLEEGVWPGRETSTTREIDVFLRRYPLGRACFLAYERVALFGREDPAFRVTFDRDIRARRTDLALELGDRGEPLLPEGWYLMESKVMGATPLWFTRLLSELRLYPTSFSKYGNYYRRTLGRWDPAALLRHRVENWNELEEMVLC